MNGIHTGFEYDVRDSFYPGKWRLDPWTVANPGPDGDAFRSSFEIHGGALRGIDGTLTSPRLWTMPTLGCIRLDTDGLMGLKSKWDNRTDNPRTMRLYVRYGT